MMSDGCNNYPERLLPKTNYRIIENESFETSSSLVLVRHIEGAEVKMDDDGTLSPSCITFQSDQLKDLSTNLLGEFHEEDIRYGIIKEFGEIYNELWFPGDDVVSPSENEFFVDETRRFFCIQVSDLVNSEGFEHDSVNWKFKTFHTPTRVNFWHVSVRVVNDEGQLVSDVDITKSKKRRIWKTAKDYLVANHIVRSSYDSTQPIPPEAYTTE